MSFPAAQADRTQDLLTASGLFAVTAMPARYAHEDRST